MSRPVWRPMYPLAARRSLDTLPSAKLKMGQLEFVGELEIPADPAGCRNAVPARRDPARFGALRGNEGRIVATRGERAVLDLFYRSTLAAYRGDREGWSRDAPVLARASRENAYLRWFMSGTETAD